MQSTSEMTPTETLIEDAERQRRWLRRACWMGFASALAAILFFVGHQVLVRWQLRQHGWVLESSPLDNGLPNWTPNWAVPWIERIDSAKFEGAQLRVSDVEYLRHFPQLSELELASTDAADPALKAVSRLSELQILFFNEVRIDAASLRHLAVLPKLEAITFYAINLDDAAFESLGECQQLVFLHCHRASLREASLRHLMRLKALEHLSLSECDLTNGGFAHIANCATLWDLRLEDVRITDNESSLPQMLNLKQLRLYECPVSDGGAKKLTKSCVNLETLWILRAPMTDEAFRDFACLPNLRSLQIIDMPMTDEGIQQLKSCSTLQSLWLNSTKVTAAGVNELVKSLPNLEVSLE